MITLIATENSFFSGRIENFLRFKNLKYKKVFYEDSPENKSSDSILIPPSAKDDFLVQIVFETGEKFSGSIPIIREIEERFPFPIGFIGPIESLLQWSSMIIAALPEFSPEILAPIFEEIVEKVEDEYFCMGPTFTVADSILASDLKNIQKNFPLALALALALQKYIERVEKK